MVRTRLTSSGLSTGGSLSGSLMCQISAARSWRRSVTRNKNRTPVMIRLRLQMLIPLSIRYSWDCRVGRAFEPGGEPLATVNVATLGMRVELARSHIFDHTLTQRTDSFSLAHGELHSE